MHLWIRTWHMVCCRNPPKWLLRCSLLQHFLLQQIAATRFVAATIAATAIHMNESAKLRHVTTPIHTHMHTHTHTHAHTYTHTCTHIHTHIHSTFDSMPTLTCAMWLVHMQTSKLSHAAVSGYISCRSGSHPCESVTGDSYLLWLYMYIYIFVSVAEDSNHSDSNHSRQ